MRKKIFRMIFFFLLVSIAVFLLLVFYPRSYPVPSMQPRKSNLFWTLSTGSRIAYTFIPAKGIKTAYPVIYLHGGPGGFITDATVDRFIPVAEQGFDVCLYDQIGSGHSERLENINEYTVSRHVRDLDEIIKNIGSTKVILIGQSWGAILACLYVVDHPDKVERMIFTCPGPIYPIRKELKSIVPPDSLQMRKPIFSNRQANEKTENLRSKAVFLWAKIFGRKLASDKEMDDFQTLLSNETNKSTVCDTSKSVKAKGGGGYYVEIMTISDLFSLPDPRPRLKNCQIPLFIMKGQCDSQLWGWTTEYLELFPHHKMVVIPNAGHSVSIEQPALYMKTLLEFLNE
ncbi:MAG: alpha/beta fold hydrolase [Bacteroidales bacterium]